MQTIATKTGRNIIISDRLADGVNGVAKDGNIILSSEISSQKILATALHEAGHMIKKTNPTEWQTLSDFVSDYLVRKGVDLNKMIDRTIERYGNRLQADEHENTRDAALEEIVCDTLMSIASDEKALNIALRTKQNKAKIAAAIKSLIAKVKDWLIGKSTNYGAKAFAKDLEALENLALRFSEAADTAKENITEQTEVQNGEKINVEKFSTEYTFEKQVDDALNGKINKRNALYVSDTSNILLRVGMKQLPMLFTQNHLNKAIKPKSSIDSHNHGLTVEQIKYMPKIIAHPAIIMDSMSTNEDIVLISDILDNDKLPIILVVHPNGQGVYELVTQPTNFIKSYYGKENFKNYVYKAMLNGNLLFIDKRKSQSLYQQMGLQLPHGFYKLGFNKIIHRSNNIVNEKFSLDEDYDFTDEKAGVIHDTLKFSIDEEYGDWLVNDDGKSVFDAVKDEKNPDRRISILYHYAGKTAEHGMSVGKDIRIGQSGMHRLVCNVL